MPPLDGNLREFFRRVHPDMFHRWPAKMKANTDSFQRLVQWMNWFDRRIEGAGTAAMPSGTRFVFHCRKSDDDHTVIKASVNLSPKSSSEGDIRKAMDEFLHTLLVDSGVVSGKTGRDHTPLPGRLVDNFRKSFQENWARARTPTVDELIADDLLSVDKTLSPHQTVKGLLALEEALPGLQYHLWYGIPVFLTTEYSTTSLPGWVCIPWNFRPTVLHDFLESNAETLQHRFDSVMSRAVAIESTIDELERELRLARLTVASDAVGSTVELETILAALMNSVDVLREVGIEGLTLECGAENTIREDGCVVIDTRGLASHSRGGFRSILEFLENHVEDFEACQEAAHSTQQVQDVIAMYVDNIQTALECTVDLSHPVSLDAKVTFLASLWEASRQLTEFNWSGWVLALGPSQDLDWEGRTLVLPADFTALDFVQEFRFGEAEGHVDPVTAYNLLAEHIPPHLLRGKERARREGPAEKATSRPSPRDWAEDDRSAAERWMEKYESRMLAEAETEPYEPVSPEKRQWQAKVNRVLKRAERYGKRTTRMREGPNGPLGKVRTKKEMMKGKAFKTRVEKLLT